MDWYAMYPHMYVGNAAVATAEKGKIIIDHSIRILAEFIKIVKEDTITPGLVDEFNLRMEKPESPDFWTEGE
jgi:hypothetical protein